MNITELKSKNSIIEYAKALDERNQQVIALDVEAEFNLHVYGEHLCLVQIYDQRDRIIIDPLRFKNKNILKVIFEKRDLLKIMYDAGGDASLLLNEYGIRLFSVLDLRPAVLLLDYEKQRLSDVLKEELGVKPTGNKKKFQTCNWMKRPIDQQAMEYAMGDVVHLFKLKDKLLKKLIDRGLLEKYMLHNLMVQNNVVRRSKEDRHKRVKGFGSLDRQGQEIFREAFYLRDSFAQKLNKSPHFIYPNSELIALCSPGKKKSQDA